MDWARRDATAVSDTGGVPTAASPPMPDEITPVFGLRCWDIALDRAARYLVECARTGERTCVFFVNAHCINVAARDAGYARLLTSAPTVFADGAGMAIAARLAGRRLVHNVNGTDLFPEMCDAAAAASVPIALLGAAPGVAQKCGAEMQRRFPGLRIVWVQHGYLQEHEERAELDSLNASGAKLLFVAKGVPGQELWLAQNAGRLVAPVLLGVGALFDFYSGTIRRAPPLVRTLRLEWLYRLALEPRRMFTRYVLGNPAFIARALAWRHASHPLQRSGKESA